LIYGIFHPSTSVAIESFVLLKSNPVLDMLEPVVQFGDAADEVHGCRRRHVFGQGTGQKQGDAKPEKTGGEWMRTTSDEVRRILMGPGPSNCHRRVLDAMSQPLLGHLDPEFLQIMDETQGMLRRVMRTENELTLPISGTGSAGMETCLCNLIEEGDPVLICVNGVFGERMTDIAERQGAEVHRVEAEWGRIIEPYQVVEAVKRFNPKLLCIVHAETSTGVLQPIEEISKIAHESDALLLVDAVTSLGGCPVETDGWGIDAIYSGTQKCLSCPPGLAPVSFSSNAVRKIQSRRDKVKSWYLDMNMIRKYWGRERFYHHTAPISMIYALNEALRLILEEGMEERFKRHRLNHMALVAGVEAMGLEMFVQPEYRSPMLNSVKIPEGVEDRVVRGELLNRYKIEIGGGLGPLTGKIWRIGLMGHSCRKENVLLLLEAFGDILGRSSSEAIEAALKVYEQGLE